MLKQQFNSLVNNYVTSDPKEEKYWNEIETAYNKPGRYYHTLHHLESLLHYLQDLKAGIKDYHAVLFALYYDDIVYNVLTNNNEEKSAALASKKLNEIGVDNTTTDKCTNIILATKKHLWNDDNDINIFTDADLSILGQDWNAYHTYLEQVRKEYAIYPDVIYNAGRKKCCNIF